MYNLGHFPRKDNRYGTSISSLPEEMSEELTASRFLVDHAVEQEKRWNWLGASESYEKALKQTPDGDHQRTGDILERRAYAFHKAALQADTHEQFEERTKEAIECYTKAKRAYEGTSEPVAPGRKSRCDAMLAYLDYWLAGNCVEKKKSIDEAWTKAKTALNNFEAAGKSLDFAVTFNQLSLAAAFSYNYDDNAETREKKLKEARGYAESCIMYLSPSDNPVELSKAHAKCTGLHVALEKDFASFADKDKLDIDAWNHWLKARELSEEAALEEIPYIVILQSWPAACSTEERLKIYTKGQELAKKTKDRFFLGCVLDGMAQRKFCEAMSADELPKRNALSKEGSQAAKDAQENLTTMRFVSPNVICVWTPVPDAGYHFSVFELEKDVKTQRELLHKAYEPCIEQLKQAKESGYPDVVNAANFMLGTVLKGMATNEADIDRKRSYLERAVEHLKKAVSDDKRIHPTQFYPQGLDLLSIAGALFEITKITSDLETKKSILKEAVLRKQESLALCEKELSATQDTNPDISGEIATGHYTAGIWAKELFSLSGDMNDLKQAPESFNKAVVWYLRAGLLSQSAETNWEAAQTYDRLGEYLKASERFDLAAKDYEKAATNIPRLNEFYADHAIYMKAWAEIERAKYHHLRQEPGLAKESYENASAMHKSTRRWSYLTANYSAWAKIEQAEDLSRNENSQEAVKAFEDAAHLFQESKSSLHDQVAKIENSSEKQMVRDLERAADIRRDYCKARIVLEQARMLDKQGDALATSEKYGQAASSFETIAEKLESDQDRKEILLMITLTKAWQAMALAEAETSPDHYERASQLFDEAKDLSTGEKAKLLVAGHSRFCKALGIGMRFVEKGDVTLHAEATKHLQSAADNYLKAGHKKESVYAKASKLLFDGYVHMGKASAEDDQGKRAKLYMMAEKVLHESAISYEDAKQPGKRDQVLRLLEKVKEERELALSLTEVLRAPDTISSTAAFPTPTPSHETATGLERFEHTDIEVILVAHPKHLHVGQDIEIEIEMTNAGKGAARLTRVEGLIPNGFEVVSKPERCMIDGNCLDLRGRRLEALRTEVVKFVMRPTIKGKFSLNPRIQYQDESGAHVDKDTAPVEVIVKEMGISGWLKGT